MNSRQTVLIGGATGNVGGGAALALAQRGAHVVLLGRRQGTLDDKVDATRVVLPEDEQEDVSLDTLTVDFADMDSVRMAADEALDRFPAIDGLVLSAVAHVQGGPNILPNGHELMFATNVMGPFLFANLLRDRITQSGGLILHVVAPFHERIDWEDLESIRKHRTTQAYNRTKTMHRMIAAEMARRYAGDITSVAFDPGFTIDTEDPTLRDRWPTGFLGIYWRVLTKLFASPPAVAGEPLAHLMLSHRDRDALNGALYKRYRRIDKRDKAMNDEASGRRLWDELAARTVLTKRS